MLMACQWVTEPERVFPCSRDLDCLTPGERCLDARCGPPPPDGGTADGGTADGGAADGGTADGGAADGGVPDGGPPAPDVCAPLEDGGLADLPGPREAHSAVLLPGCRVLVTGGANGMGGSRVDSWIYDGRRRGWFDAGSTSQGRVNHEAVAFPDGSAWVTGGTVNGSNGLVTSERFDSRAWSLGPSFAVPRSRHTSAATPDGGVFVVGGFGNGTTTASIERCCSADGGWFSAGALVQNRARHSMTLLPGGRVLIVGGAPTLHGDGPPLTSAELYDPLTHAVTDAGHLAVGRSLHAAVQLDAGVLVLGGYMIGAAVATDTVEWFDLATLTWSCLPRLGAPRARFAAAVVDPSTVLIAGGDSAEAILDSSELYRLGDTVPCPSTQLPIGTDAGTMNEVRPRPTLTRLPNGSILAVGGQGSQLYVPDAGGWQPRP